MELIAAVERCDVEMVRDLLEKEGTNVNMSDSQKNNKTSLMISASKNCKDCIEIMKLLMENNCDLTIKDDTGMDALMYASKYGSTPAVELLLSANVDVNSKTNKDNTPLIFAVRYRRHEIANMLIEAGSSVNAQNVLGNTAAHVASYTGDVDTIKVLIKHKADFGISNYDGALPLTIVEKLNYTEAEELIKSEIK